MPAEIVRKSFVKYARPAIAIAVSFIILNSLVGMNPVPAHAAGAATDTLASVNVVPKPRQATLTASGFVLPAQTTIVAQSADERTVADVLVTFLRSRGIAATIAAQPNAAIRLSLEHDLPTIGREGYRLRVDATGIAISANAPAGLFYGVQTLEQLVPPTPGAALPGVDIVDWPAYAWRGMHLDVSRHFFGPDVVERYIDVAAHYKLNTFHWHLTDDQGWRIPIARYPDLTRIGGCRAGSEIGNDPAEIDPHRYCGAYTRAQITAIVAYARARYVTIVPEIEMPGHAVAALTAYPWLGCSTGPFHVRETWGVSTDIFCPTERTFGFVSDVLTEVMALFPGAYIHIGGDEVPTDAWQRSAFVHGLMQREHLRTYPEVQGYFTRRIERFLAAHGRKLIGWDEILDGGVSRNATVMSWRGTSGGIIAARRGNDVVMTPDGPLYLDWAQGDTDYEPVAIDGLSTPQMIYDFNPTPAELSAADARHILGVQGNLWTERIPTENQLFYMLLPRELAVAEDAWTPAADRVWSDFVTRSAPQYAWFEAQHLPFRIPDPTLRVVDAAGTFPESVHRSANETELRVVESHGTIAIADEVPGATIYYTTDGTVPTAASHPYVTPVAFDLTTIPVVHVRAIAVIAGGRASAPTTLTLRR
jgi:hexosaminidase